MNSEKSTNSNLNVVNVEDDYNVYFFNKFKSLFKDFVDFCILNLPESTLLSEITKISNLYEKLKQIKKDNIYLIDKETLNEINSEYLLFQTQRNNITALIQEYNSNIIKQIENINFNCLNKYLCSKIDSNKVVGIYKCNICNIYTSNKLKGISAHKRGCKNKCKIETTQI